ncbi:MAG: hypothetical protein GY898_15865 [Proteobacteria bacterium]|nr:hypothetical protein [Pseudomonadota bacterium]
MPRALGLLGVGVLLIASGVSAEVRDAVPRTVAVSAAADHVFATFTSVVVPADLGVETWAAHDTDGDGVISEAEAKPMLGAIRAAELEYLCIAVDGTVVPLARMVATSPEPITIDGPVTLRVQGRATMTLGAGEHSFVLYDRPRADDGIVPIRFNVVAGMEITGAEGARAEMKGKRRLEAVVSRFAPAVWGTFVVR